MFGRNPDCAQSRRSLSVNFNTHYVTGSMPTQTSKNRRSPA
jgi:hypothetical protein